MDQQGIRLAMAQASTSCTGAYDMLAGYEINYKTLKEYKEDRGLDEAMRSSPSRRLRSRSSNT